MDGQTDGQAAVCPRGGILLRPDARTRLTVCVSGVGHSRDRARGAARGPRLLQAGGDRGGLRGCRGSSRSSQNVLEYGADAQPCGQRPSPSAAAPRAGSQPGATLPASCPRSSALSWELRCRSLLSAASFSRTRPWAASRSASRRCTALLSAAFSALSVSSLELSSDPLCEAPAHERGAPHPGPHPRARTTPEGPVLLTPPVHGERPAAPRAWVRAAPHHCQGPLGAKPVASGQGPVHGGRRARAPSRWLPRGGPPTAALPARCGSAPPARAPALRPWPPAPS